ncbi:MAG: M6 family metalloprotease domain-containing protein, partial [Calditrichaeota bacterium]|nr:M6 family metalloprotease domain-containing protein [Calditrichota bacterium]
MKFIRQILLVALLLLSAELNAMPLSPESIEHLRASGQLEQVLSRFAEAQSRGIDYPGVNILDNLRSQRRDNPVDIEISLPIILVDFSDNRANQNENDADMFRQILFSLDELDPGSLREWFLENSYGEVAVVGEVVGWIRLERTYAYYVDGQYGIGNYPRNSQGMTRDAVIAADNQLNFSQFDNDDDGTVDVVAIVHAGSSAEANRGDEDMIWSHCSSLGGNAVRLDGVMVRTFVTVPEDGHIGVLSHELGHGLFDLPDLYDRDGSSQGLGDWSVMAGGSWNGRGASPAHYDAWSKMQLGFIEPIVLDENLENVRIPPVETEGSAYVLWDRGRARSEYFLIENRQRLGFDAELPGQGLLVYHIDDNMIESQNDNEWSPGNENEGHYLVALEQADGEYELELTASRGDGSDPFPGTHRNSTFNAESEPSSLAYSGANSNVAITDIVIQNRIAICDITISSGDDEGFIVINEFQSNNNNTFRDPEGEYDDWIEIYNGTNGEVDLTGHTMSDDAEEPDMWLFPDATRIPAADFLIIWADRDMEQNGIHANFTLNQRGETVGLWAPNGDEIDIVDFGEQQADWSLGREEDGADNWVEFENPTPGRSNIEEVEAPAIEVDPLAIEAANGGEHVITISNVGNDVLAWDSELEIIEEPDRDKSARGVRGVGPVRTIEVPSDVAQQAYKHGFATESQIDEINNYRAAIQEDSNRPRRDARGEPDEEGYYWVDSDEEDGPGYQWIDISEIGQRLEVADDWSSQWIQLGFQFPWYDEEFEQLRICSNGFITFDNYADAPWEVLPRAPNRAEPNNLFQVLNRDWNPMDGGEMYFWTNEEDLAVVSWVNVPPFDEENITSTFQAVFSGLGIVLYQYGPQQGVDGEWSAVGFENGDGTLGSTIVYGEAGRIEEGLCIAIGRDFASQWIAYEPTQGEIAPGRETDIFVILDSEGLQAGVYEADLHILSNDEDNPDISVNITMEVEGAPAIVVDPEEVDFGRLGIRRVRELDITIVNVGTDVLIVENILIEGDYFSLEFEDAIELPVGEDVDVTVAFEPEEIGNYEGLVSVFSNDPNDDIVEVNLFGIGVEGGGEQGEDIIGYDDGEPSLLFTTENYWSKTIFTAPDLFELQSIVFMPLNAGPNPNAPCDLRVYSLDGDYNLEQLMWEGRIDRLDPFDFDNIEDMWITIEFDQEDWVQFEQGEDFAIMYGPAPGGEYAPDEQGAGWWNLTDE